MAETLSWINKGSNALPDWAAPHQVGRRDPNGSFLIRTPMTVDGGRRSSGGEKQKTAQARVLVGHMLIERNGAAYSKHPSEARAFLAELDEVESGIYATLKSAEMTPGRKFGRSEADVADMRDDTDDISLRIAAATQRIQAPMLAGKPTSKPQRTGGKTSESISRKSPRFRAQPVRGQMPTIEWIQLERLLVDDAYQRSVDTGPSRALIDRIGRDWDWRLCVPLMVSRRADGLYVIDGQHRLFGARKRRDVPQLPCCISVYDGPADEAAMFVAANRERRAMNRLDDFHAALAASDKDATIIRRLVEEVGFAIARTTGSATWRPGEVAFTSSIRTVLRKHGEDHVREILRALADAFPEEVLLSGGSLFLGLSRIIVTPPASLDKARLFLALKRFDAAGWASMIEGMKGGSDRSTAMRDALLMAYDETEIVQ